MDFVNVRVKLDYLRNLIESEGPKRTILAELSDIERIIREEETKMAPFPIMCTCDKKGTKEAHTRTSQAIAEQAYINYARYFGREQSLERMRERGGFTCVEIRMLLAGLNPAEFVNDTVNGKARRERFLAMHPDIKS
jgi:hypothetical protein